MNAERELQLAQRSLLSTPLLDAGDVSFALVRRHTGTLQRAFRDLLGYELVVRAGYARLKKHCDHLRHDRPATVPRPGMHVDVRPEFTPRHYVLLCLALAACSRSSGPQTTIGMLAEDVRSLAVEDGVAVDFEQRVERARLGETLSALVEMGVLSLVDGTADAWVRGPGSSEQALYDIDQGRIDDLLVCGTALTATCPEDLLERPQGTQSGEMALQARRRALARRLVEDPALLVDELDDEQRAYYTNAAVRGPLDAEAARLTGCVAERRREGTALIDDPQGAPMFSDVRFPHHRPWDRQAALLVAEALCARVHDGATSVTLAEVLEICETIVAEYHKQLTSESPVSVRDAALAVLTRMALVDVREGRVIARPPLARYAAVDMTEARKRVGHGAQGTLLDGEEHLS